MTPANVESEPDLLRACAADSASETGFTAKPKQGRACKKIKKKKKERERKRRKGCQANFDWERDLNWMLMEKEEEEDSEGVVNRMEVLQTLLPQKTEWAYSP